MFYQEVKHFKINFCGLHFYYLLSLNAHLLGRIPIKREIKNRFGNLQTNKNKETNKTKTLEFNFKCITKLWWLFLKTISQISPQKGPSTHNSYPHHSSVTPTLNLIHPLVFHKKNFICQILLLYFFVCSVMLKLCR